MLFKIAAHCGRHLRGEWKTNKRREGFIKLHGKVSKTDSYAETRRTGSVHLLRVRTRKQTVGEKSSGVDRGY